MNENQEVWVFNGAGARFASAVFSTREAAEEWIARHSLAGILTKYPVDIAVYDWAVANGAFNPKKEEHSQAEFIGKFTTASQEHCHYEDGKII